MTRLEEWRVREIGKLMIEAGELSVDEEERHHIFFEISRLIDYYGLYETAEAEIAKLVKKYEK